MAFESEISAILRTQPKIRLAVLFGSLGRTRGRADSDLDIAVAAAQPFTAEEKIELIQNLAAAFGRPVDVVDLQAATG
ncbi:MAG: nucleotidyltransferase domain-containing protein, partial [Gammaproteobacteria bacterium]